MNIRNKSFRLLLFFLLFIFWVISAGVFFHTHHSEAEADNCQLCYAINIFVSSISVSFVTLILILNFLIYVNITESFISKTTDFTLFNHSPPLF